LEFLFRWQERGFPHAKLLVNLRRQNRPDNALRQSRGAELRGEGREIGVEQRFPRGNGLRGLAHGDCGLHGNDRRLRDLRIG
jgi:hypothetical protein